MIQDSVHANSMAFIAHLLLLSGLSGKGKSWLIKTTTESTEIMELDISIKMSLMGIAALNINGYTINSLLDVPLEMNKHTGSTQK